MFKYFPACLQLHIVYHIKIIVFKFILFLKILKFTVQCFSSSRIRGIYNQILSSLLKQIITDSYKYIMVGWKVFFNFFCLMCLFCYLTSLWYNWGLQPCSFVNYSPPLPVFFAFMHFVNKHMYFLVVSGNYLFLFIIHLN